MQALIATFRQRRPDTELYASVDTRGNRMALPFMRVLASHITAWLPEVYPLAFRPARPAGFVERAFADCLDGKDFGGIPVLPTIQTYDGIGAQAVVDQVAEVNRRGLPGYQAYTIAHATDEEWAAAFPKEDTMTADEYADQIIEHAKGLRATPVKTLRIMRAIRIGELAARLAAQVGVDYGAST
jgi:hypothetical protein